MLSLRTAAEAKMPGVEWVSLRALAHLALNSGGGTVSTRAVSLCTLTGRAIAKANIDHIFVLMMENRSFDHVFGFSPILGLDPKKGIYREINNVRNYPPSCAASLIGGGERTIAATPDAHYQLAGDHEDPAHEFVDIMRQLCGDITPAQMWDGKLINGNYPEPTQAGFVQAFVTGEARHGLSDALNMASADIPMQCFSPEKLPVLNALGASFAVCDAWHASMPGPTLPNRLFVHAASSAGYDDSPSGLSVGASGIGLSAGVKMPHGTIYSMMSVEGLEWRIYSDDNPIITTTSFLDGIDFTDISSFDDFSEDINDEDFDARFIFIEPNYEQFSDDPGSYGGAGNSMHPVCDMRLGEKFIASVYNKLRLSKIWPRSALIITFDEHGGFYDHVVPPVAVPPDDNNTASHANNSHGFRFDRLGPRVPSMIVSPHIPNGMVDGTVYDHSSILASTERRFGLAAMTARDKKAADFWHLFTLEQPRDDVPTQFADHPPEYSTLSHKGSDPMMPAAVKPDILRNKSAAGIIVMVAGAQLKALKDRVTPPEYAIWQHRLNNAVDGDALKAAVGEAKVRLEGFAAPRRPRRRPQKPD